MLVIIYNNCNNIPICLVLNVHNYITNHIVQKTNSRRYSLPKDFYKLTSPIALRTRIVSFGLLPLSHHALHSGHLLYRYSHVLPHICLFDYQKENHKTLLVIATTKLPRQNVYDRNTFRPDFT